MDAAPQPRLEKGGDATTDLHWEAAETEEGPARQHRHCTTQNPFSFGAQVST